MKLNTPTQEAIKKEIAKLREIKPHVQPRSIFGDDNHAAIDFVIEVLEEELEEDEIFNRSNDEGEDFEDKKPASTRDAALQARRWLDGDEKELPSNGWPMLASMVAKPKKKR